VIVEELFGQYSYDLKSAAEGRDLSHLLILYGENGTGKTTILQLMYHLLSRERRKGHRTYLAHTPFKKFVVQLTDRVEIVAERERAVSGDFVMKCNINRSETGYSYKTRTDGSIPGDAADEEFIGSLPDINVAFLPDDRKISEAEEEDKRNVLRLVSASPSDYWTTEKTDGPSGVAATAPAQALATVLQWARDQALKASDEGQRDVDAVYAELVRRLARFKETAQAPEQLMAKLSEQAARTLEYSKFGLTAELRVDDLTKSLSAASPERFDVLAQVLKPYLESNDARLKALAPLQQTLETFVDSMRSFYKNKRVTLDLRDGMQIFSPDNQRLDPRSLSSGERQLLILFCNVVQASDRATIFIIDEPELSLNVEWQRQLIDTLIKMSRDNIQFVFATHSLELLARHRAAVVSLNPARKFVAPPSREPSNA